MKDICLCLEAGTVLLGKTISGDSLSVLKHGKKSMLWAATLKQDLFTPW